MKNIYSQRGMRKHLNFYTTQHERIAASRRFYKPTATRTPVLLVLLAITVSLFVFTEIAIRRVPAHKGIGKLGNTVNNALHKRTERRLLKRQNASSLSYVPAVPAASVSTSAIVAVNSDPYLALGNPAPVVSTLPYPTATGPYLTPGAGITRLSAIVAPLTVPTIGEITPIKGSNLPSVTSVPAGGYLTPGVDSTPGNPVPTPIFSNGQAIVTVVGGQTYDLTLGVTVTGGITYLQTPVITVIDGIAMAVTPEINVADGKTYTQLPIVTAIDGKTYAITPYVIVKDSTTFTTTPLPFTVQPATATGGYNKPGRTHSAIAAAVTIVNSTGVYYKISTGEIHFAPQITLREYILVAFVPLIIAVLYTMPCKILDSTFQEMEPFYQLNQPGGALGKNSLCLDYSTSWLVTIPFRAGSRGHFVPLWSSLISMSVLFIAPLSSEAFFVSVYGDCVANSTGECHAIWGVYPALARVIQGILAFIFALLVLIILFTIKRQSGVYSEPMSMAGLGVLLSKSPLLNELRQIDSMVPSKELKQIMEGKRFRLADFVAEDQTYCQGIVGVDSDSQLGFASSGILKEKKGAYTSVGMDDDSGITEYDGGPAPKRGLINWNTGISTKKDAKQKLMYLGAFLIVSGLLTLISYYHWTGPVPITGKSTGFETFMDSQGFGVRFMMSGLGVWIKLLWANVDSDLRRDTPYIHLLRGSSPPRDCILLPHYSTNLSAILPSLTRLHFLSAMVAFLAFLAEFLPIFLANIAYSPAMSKDAYNICHFFSMVILILMILVTIVLLVKRPSGVGSLPRRPGQGGPVNTAIYLAAPSEVESTGGNRFGTDVERKRERGLLDCLAGLSTLGTRERDDAIKRLGSLYSMGVVEGGQDVVDMARGKAGAVREELRIDDDRRVRRLLRE